MTEWSAERISDLARLWGEGITAGEIGRRLGVSKSAVVGKAHRLNLRPRQSPIKRAPARGERKDHPWSAAATAKPQPAVSASGGVVPQPIRDPLKPGSAVRAATREDYAGRGESRAACAWPIGDPRGPEFRFCGRRAVRRKPYCADHCAAAYVIARPGPA